VQAHNKQETKKHLRGWLSRDKPPYLSRGRVVRIPIAFFMPPSFCWDKLTSEKKKVYSEQTWREQDLRCVFLQKQIGEDVSSLPHTPNLVTYAE